MAKKITQYPTSGGNPDVGSLIDVSELIGGVYTSKSLSFQQLLDYLTANLDVGSTQSFYNNTGSTILAGTPVEINSQTSNTPNVRLITGSSNDGLSKIYVAKNNVLNGSAGEFIENGIVNLNTASYSAGQKLFWNLSTSSFTTSTLNEDQLFVGVVLTSNVSGKIFVSPTHSPQLVRGATNQIPLFTAPRKLTGSTHFTWVDNAGTEVGFTFDDGANNVTKVGVTFINVESEGLASNSVLRLANWADNANKGIVSFRKSRGSKATPSKVLVNDVLGSLIFAGQADKITDGGIPVSSGMTTGEIIVRAMNNFIKNFDSAGYETFAQGLTQFEIWMQGSNELTFGDFTPVNTKVFSVDGDGTLRLKDNKLVFQLDYYNNVNLSIGDTNDSIIFNEVTGQFTLSSKTQNTQIISQTGTTGFYPKFQLTKGETGGNFPYNDAILGAISSNGNDIIRFVAREDHTLADRGTDVVFYTLLTGGGSYIKEVLRLSSTSGKLRVSNVYELPNVDGTSGQTLITNGAGVLSWQTPSSSSVALSYKHIAIGNASNVLSSSQYFSYDNGFLNVGTSGGSAKIQTQLVSDTNYPMLILSRFKVSGTYVIANDIIGSLSTNTMVAELDILRAIATESHSPSNAGQDVVLYSIGNGTLVQKEVLRLGQDGRLKVSNAYKLPLTDGTPNQLMATNGSGQVSFVNNLSPITQDKWALPNSAQLRGQLYNPLVTTKITFGSDVGSETGTKTAKTPTAGSELSKKISCKLAVSTSSANGNCSLRGTNLNYFRENGILFSCGFAVSDTGYNASSSMFVGLSALTIFATSYTAPATVGNSLWNSLSFVGVGNDGYSASFTGSCTGTTLTVSAITYGTLEVGQSFSTATVGTKIVSQLSGTPGGIGTYQLSISQTITNSTMRAFDLNLCIISNDASGNATKFSLGDNFPANRLAGAVNTNNFYVFEMYSGIDATEISWRIRNTGIANSVQEGTITTNVPALGIPMNYHIYRNSMGDSNACSFDISHLYCSNLS